MELRGEVRGGRFVSQVSGEQFALQETVDQLRKVRKEPLSGDLISISAADPLNLVGIILPGRRIANITSNRVVFRDGIPLAVWEGKETKYIVQLPKEEEWGVYKALVQRKFPTKLRHYVGKN